MRSRRWNQKNSRYIKSVNSLKRQVTRVMKTSYRTDLTEEQWELLRQLIPPAQRVRAVRRLRRLVRHSLTHSHHDSSLSWLWCWKKNERTKASFASRYPGINDGSSSNCCISTRKGRSKNGIWKSSQIKKQFSRLITIWVRESKIRQSSKTTICASGACDSLLWNLDN